MKKLVLVMILVLLLSVSVMSIVQADTSQEDACWGQASKVFAQMGEMGEHSSGFPTPRLGLRNLARAVFGEDGTMQDLGAFVEADLGLEIDACVDLGE
jgi:hypothetical protein